jgi:MFS family permease
VIEKMADDGKRVATWAALKHPVFRSLWIANVASGIGGTMHDTAAVWTMTTLTTSATMVGFMQTVTALPLFLFALPAGALADIVNRRRQILIAQAACLFVAAILAGLTAAGLLSAPVLLTMTFLLGVGAAFTMPPWQALMPEIVPKETVSSAVTLGGIGVNVSRAIGPIVGGLLVASSGPAVVFLVNAISFVGVIIALWLWKEEQQAKPSNPERMLGAMAAALRFTRYSSVVKAVLARNALFAFFGICVMAVLPLRVKELKFAATDFGILMGCYGVGGIFSAFVLLPFLRQRLKVDSLLLLTAFLSAGAISLLALITERTWMMLVLFVAGSSWLMTISNFSVAGQNAYPKWVRARSSAVQLIAFQAALGIGGALWGAVTSSSNTSTALFVAAGGLVLTAFVGRFLPISSEKDADLTPSQHWAPHTFTSEPAPDDGPVLVTLTYEVSTHDVANFREAMQRLRIIRLRDGAVRWSLSKNLSASNQFREAFVVGSWGEHVRQHVRATNADKAIEDAALSFHEGKQPPKVEHFLIVAS